MNYLEKFHVNQYHVNSTSVDDSIIIFMYSQFVLI